MNAERGRGGHRGRGRNSSGRNNGQRGGGRNIYRTSSDGQGANAFPPGLRVPDSQNQYSSSVPTASGWDLPEDSQQNGTSNLRQAGIQAAERAVHVPVRQQGQYRGNRAQRRDSGGFNATDSSPGLGRSQSGQNRRGASVERDSGPSSFGRRSSGTRQAQSNIVPIPQRYFNSSNGTFHSPGSGRQAAGTPDNRSRDGTAHAILKSVALHIPNSTPAVTIQRCICGCAPYFGILSGIIIGVYSDLLSQVVHCASMLLCALVAAMCCLMSSCAHVPSQRLLCLQLNCDCKASKPYQHELGVPQNTSSTCLARCKSACRTTLVPLNMLLRGLHDLPPLDVLHMLRRGSELSC